MKIIRKRAYARAGVIGNPSDGYGGRTIAMTLGNFFADVVMYPWDRLEIVWSEQDQNRFESIDDLLSDVTLNGDYGGVRLVKASIKRFVEFCRRAGHPLHEHPFSVRYETRIPRGLGLSGSSAIVVATLRCLMEFYDVAIPLPLQASLARSVENDELLIACGYQDRVSQVYQGLVLMDFSSMQQEQGLEYGHYEYVEPDRLPTLYVAFDAAASKTSASVHGPLRTRLANDEQLAQTMREIAALVPAARDAILAGERDQLHELMDRNFDLRQSLYTIRPEHLALIHAARRCGASAKFAGSGGAIIGTCENEAARERLRDALQAQNSNWQLIAPQLVPVPAGERGKL